MPILTMASVKNQMGKLDYLNWCPGGIVSNYGHKEGRGKFSLPCYMSYNHLSEHLYFYTGARPSYYLSNGRGCYGRQESEEQREEKEEAGEQAESEKGKGRLCSSRNSSLSIKFTNLLVEVALSTSMPCRAPYLRG